MYHCLNVVTEPAARPAARADPRRRAASTASTRCAPRGRGRDARGSAGGTGVARRAPTRGLAAGPGLVAAAFDIDRSHTGVDLCDPASPLRLEARPPDEPAPAVVATPRIGIAYAGEPWARVPWRFVVAGSPSLSRRVPADPAT